MKYVLSLLFLTSCTFKIETRSEEEINKIEHAQDIRKLYEYCKDKCQPLLVTGIIPVDRRCICDARD